MIIYTLNQNILIMESDIFTGIGLFGSIVGIIALITFFVMAWRLGNISNYLFQIGYRITNQPFYEAHTAELLGKNQEALEKYIHVLYLVTVTKYRVHTYNKKQSTDFLVEKITKLGGVIPDIIREKNPYLS